MLLGNRLATFPAKHPSLDSLPQVVETAEVATTPDEASVTQQTDARLEMSTSGDKLQDTNPSSPVAPPSGGFEWGGTF